MRAFVVAVVLLLSGCSGGHENPVSHTSEAWAQAVRSGDWATACELMAPVTVMELEKSAKTDCAKALPGEATETGDEAPQVSAYGKSGQASWSDETLFLGDFDGRWLVWAASCTPTGADEPYDCAISGG